MSRGVVPSLRVHLLPRRVYHTLTPASHLTPLRRQLRIPCSLVVAEARTITNYKYGSKLGKSFRSDSVAHGQDDRLPRDATDVVCTQYGFTPEQSLALWHVLRDQLGGSYSPLESYRWLHNYTGSNENPANVPSPRCRSEEDLIWHEKSKGLAAPIGQHKPENMSRALNALGFYLIKAAFNAPRKGYKMTKTQVQQAFFIFEIAILYKNLESAVWLLKLGADPVLQDLGESPNTIQAKDLVYRTVEADPRRCTWQALCVYTGDASSLVELRKQTPKQRALAIQALQHAGSEILPGQAAADLFAFQVFANPWTLLLRLIENCLDWSLPIHDYTLEKMEELRLLCWRQLTEYNDPAACFEIATREKQFASEDWVRLMKCAATEAQPDACWLLAIHYWREDGLLAICNRPTKEDDEMPADEKRKLQSAIKKKKSQAAQSLGFEWAAIALFHHQDRPHVWNKRAVATAALFRTFLSREAGGILLRDLLDHTEDKRWYIARQRRILEDVLRDYNAEVDPHNLWSLERCLSEIKKITDKSPQTTKAMGVIAEHLPESPEPVGTSKRVSRSFRNLLPF